MLESINISGLLGIADPDFATLAAEDAGWPEILRKQRGCVSQHCDRGLRFHC
jgi:hypothetical protein